ncbi:MAG: hypothetical protein KGH79_04070 [Patescibacteria group bacterium]|nr:hypothetical protein [Patescibacteria group bacterium]
MSTYEKIATVIIAVLLAVMVVYSYRELSEKRPPRGGPNTGPNFSQSLGQDFIIGPFATVANEQSSGGPEDNCDALKPVIVGALHDIKEHLEHGGAYAGGEQAFEVNEPALQLLCNKNAEITLSDSGGDMLILQKVPFTREVPPQGTPADIGTAVRINATVVPKGAPVPAQPTTYGYQLIPDRYLDAAATSAL